MLYQDQAAYQQSSEHSKAISEYYSKENVLKIWKDFYTKVYNEQESGALLAQRRRDKQKKND